MQATDLKPRGEDVRPTTHERTKESLSIIYLKIMGKKTFSTFAGVSGHGYWGNKQRRAPGEYLLTWTKIAWGQEKCRFRLPDKEAKLFANRLPYFLFMNSTWVLIIVFLDPPYKKNCRTHFLLWRRIYETGINYCRKSLTNQFRKYGKILEISTENIAMVK